MYQTVFMAALTAYAAPYIAGYLVHMFMGSYQQAIVIRPQRKIVCIACERKSRITGKNSICKLCEQASG